MIIEVKLNFKDEYTEGEGDPIEFVHTLTAPEGMEITGGQIYVENPSTSNLERFSFRIDRAKTGEASLVIMEDPNS